MTGLFPVLPDLAETHLPKGSKAKKYLGTF